MICNGKQIFQHPKYARKAANQIRQRARVEIFVYQCHECEGWHLTSMKPEMYKKIAQSRKDVQRQDIIDRMIGEKQHIKFQKIKRKKKHR